MPSKYGFYAESISQSRQDRVNTAVYGERASMGFTIFNVGAGRNFIIGKNTLNVHAAVYNILDKQYYEHLDILKLYRPGRNVALNLSLTF
ncbi:TonB dependent receptor [compost metagenome]